MKYGDLIRAGEQLLRSNIHKHDESLLTIIGLAYDQLALRTKNLIKRQNYQRRAASYFKKILAKNPNSVQALRNLGLVALHRNKLFHALRYYKRAYCLVPTDVSNISSLGNVFRGMKRYNLAIRWYKKGLRRKESKTTSILNLAALYWDIKKKKLARKYALRALHDLRKKRDAYSIMFRERMRELIKPPAK